MERYETSNDGLDLQVRVLRNYGMEREMRQRNDLHPNIGHSNSILLTALYCVLFHRQHCTESFFIDIILMFTISFSDSKMLAVEESRIWSRAVI